MKKSVEHIQFVEGVDFEFINSLKNDGTKYLLIFDDSCDEICSSKAFVKVATAGRHRGLSTIYIKHNLFHQSNLGRDVELQNTHIVLFKSPRDVLQINTLSTQLGLGSTLVEWYRDATSTPFGHLLIDLTPRTDDRLRYCTNSGSIPSKFYVPKPLQHLNRLDDEYTKSLYSPSVPAIFPHLQKYISSKLPNRVYPISKRVHSESARGKFARVEKGRRGNVQTRNSPSFIKKNQCKAKKGHFVVKKRLATRKNNIALRH